jgi:transcriptional regulator with XRE-family HTH domain
MTAIGDSIRKIRDIKGYSQEYVAQKLNMSQNNYGRIELGKVKLDVDRLKEIATVLEVDPMDIMNFDERYVFNSISQNQNGGETINNSGIFHNETLIKELKEDISYLREENKRLLSLLEKGK